MLWLLATERSSGFCCSSEKLPEEARLPSVCERPLGKARGWRGKGAWLEVHLRRYMARQGVCEGRGMGRHLRRPLLARVLGMRRWPPV